MSVLRTARDLLSPAPPGRDDFEVEFKSHVIGGGGLDDFRLNIRSMALSGDLRCQDLLRWAGEYINGELVSRGLESWRLEIGDLYNPDGTSKSLEEIPPKFHKYLSYKNRFGEWVMKGKDLDIYPTRPPARAPEAEAPQVLKDAIKTLNLDRVMDGDKLIQRLADPDTVPLEEQDIYVE